MVVGPDAVPVRADPVSDRAVGVSGRPPAHQPYVGVGTGVGQEVDEELIRADLMRQVAGGDDAVLLLANRPGSGHALVLDQCGVSGGQWSGDPVHGWRLAGPVRDEPV